MGWGQVRIRAQHRIGPRAYRVLVVATPRSRAADSDRDPAGAGSLVLSMLFGYLVKLNSAPWMLPSAYVIDSSRQVPAHSLSVFQT